MALATVWVDAGRDRVHSEVLNAFGGVKDLKVGMTLDAIFPTLKPPTIGNTSHQS
jgi:hypothetical protein